MKEVTKIKKYCYEDVEINMFPDMDIKYIFKAGNVYEFDMFDTGLGSILKSVKDGHTIMNYSYTDDTVTITIFDSVIEKFMSMSEYRKLKINNLLNDNEN